MVPLTTGQTRVVKVFSLTWNMKLARPRLRPARGRGSKTAWEQHRLGETASLRAGPKFVKGPGTSSHAADIGSFFGLCLHVQVVWESNYFTGSWVPLIESLKSKAHLITDARKRKNLTHLQRVLLFKHSSEPVQKAKPA